MARKYRGKGKRKW